MSFLKYFSFKNLGHYVAVAVKDIVAAGPTIQKDIAVAGGVASTVVAAVDPNAAPAVAEIQRASSAALGYVVDAASKINAVADGTNTLTIQGLTSAEVQDFKALATYFTQHAYANGVTLPASS
jgi:hypothetical protein